MAIISDTKTEKYTDCFAKMISLLINLSLYFQHFQKSYRWINVLLLVNVGGCRRCSSAGRALDWHTADAGSIPWCGKGLSPRVNFQCKLSYSVCALPCAITCINICPHVEDPVICQSSVDYRNTKTPSIHYAL